MLDLVPSEPETGADRQTWRNYLTSVTRGEAFQSLLGPCHKFPLPTGSTFGREGCKGLCLEMGVRDAANET